MQAAVHAGASIVNDISAGEMDKNMITTVASLGVPYICMHLKGVPETMHLDIQYENVRAEVLDFFIRKIKNVQHGRNQRCYNGSGFWFWQNY